MATITEDYKEKLKEALNSDNTDYEVVRWIEQNFPELKESEDERIVKELLTFFRECVHGGHILTNKEYDSWIAWLEKQGEQKCTYQLNNLKSNIKFPFKAKVKSSGAIVTIHGGQLSPDGKEWIKYQSDAEDRYKVYEPNSLELVCEIEQKSAWSEEDEHGFENCLYAIKEAFKGEKILIE